MNLNINPAQMKSSSWQMKFLYNLLLIWGLIRDLLMYIQILKYI